MSLLFAEGLSLWLCQLSLMLRRSFFIFLQLKLVERCSQEASLLRESWQNHHFLLICNTTATFSSIPPFACSDLHFVWRVGAFSRLVRHLVFPHGIPLLLWERWCLSLLPFAPLPFPSQSNQLLLFSQMELLSGSVPSLRSYFHGLLITGFSQRLGSSWLGCEWAWETSRSQ